MKVQVFKRDTIALLNTFDKMLIIDTLAQKIANNWKSQSCCKII